MKFNEKTKNCFNVSREMQYTLTHINIKHQLIIIKLIKLEKGQKQSVDADDLQYTIDSAEIKE